MIWSVFCFNMGRGQIIVEISGAVAFGLLLYLDTYIPGYLVGR